MHHSRRRGFTLIEVLVSITIIGLLVALIIPAVLSAREASRRMKCASNLRQLGIALSSYNATLNSLPLMTNGKKGYSPHSMILPYIEQKNLFNAINFSVAYFDRSNVTANNVILSAFICPSDGGAGNQVTNNYPACVGYGYQLSHSFNGIFAKRPEGLFSLSNVPDGTSNTAMMAEWVAGSLRRKRDDVGRKRDELGTIYFTNKLINRDEFDKFLSQCEGVETALATKVLNNKGASWLQSDMGQTLYNHNLTPNKRTCNNGNFFFEGAWTASSRHESGVHVLFADGHIAFVKNTIVSAVWNALSTWSGGEIVSGSDF